MASTELARMINAARRERGWSQSHLAGMIGVSTSYVQALENTADKRTPSARVCHRLASALGYSPEAILMAAMRLPKGEPLSLTTEERELVETYRALPQALRGALLAGFQSARQTVGHPGS